MGRLLCVLYCTVLTMPRTKHITSYRSAAQHSKTTMQQCSTAHDVHCGPWYSYAEMTYPLCGWLCGWLLRSSLLYADADRGAIRFPLDASACCALLLLLWHCDCGGAAVARVCVHALVLRYVRAALARRKSM